MRTIGPVQLYKATVSSGTVTTNILDTRFMTDTAFLISTPGGSSLVASVKAFVSFDNINYYDSGMIFPAIASGANNIPVEGPGGFPYVELQITRSAGSGVLTVTGYAKGVAR